jgi:MFS family permease
VAFAIGNLLGPIVLGPLFDTVGRKPMISGTYILSGVLLLIIGYLFDHHQLTATTLTLSWSGVFFFASAGVSAAYLTVSEIFPMETRALAIALFYAVGTGIGGIIGPQLFGRLVPTGKTSDVFLALSIGAILMIVGGVVEIVYGVKAERRRLEGIAKPLTAVGDALRSTATRGCRRQGIRSATHGITITRPALPTGRARRGRDRGPSRGRRPRPRCREAHPGQPPRAQCRRLPIAGARARRS